jgi:SAM-dependent methyltransferase
MADPRWNPWCNDRRTLELYRQRCREETDEMTCAAQAAEILADLVSPGETLLDAGCGGGYYYNSLKKRGVAVDYFGLDFTPEMIHLATSELCPRTGLDPARFQLGWIEYVRDHFDNVLCFNVLTNSPHYALPLERLLLHTKRRLLLRESMASAALTRFTPDPYLDEGKRHIRVYHNVYPLEEVVQFIQSYGFTVTGIVDRRTQDKVEMVVDLPHFWRILLAERVSEVV